MPRRITRSTSKSAYVSQILAVRPSKAKVFGQIWEVQLFAAAVGFASARRSSLVDAKGKPDGDSSTAIDFSTFSGSGAWPGFINALALVDAKDPECLNAGEENEEIRVRAFEEYANAGIEILHDNAVADMSVVGLADFIMKFSEPCESEITPPALI